MRQRLETKRLGLRPFVQSDAKSVFEYWTSDQGWERFNNSVPADFTQTHAEKFVADLLSRSRESQPTWAVLLNEEVVGIVSLTFEHGHRIAVVGYGVHGALRGKGLSVEASNAVIDCAFECYSQLCKIRAHTDARNVGSTRVLEKLGFTREGVLRSNQFVKGQFIDEAIYGLLRSEWPGSFETRSIR